MFVPSWTYGQPAAFDLAITSPQRQDTLRQAALEAGSAARSYEDHKRSHLQTEEECRQQGILFVPLVAEASGGWGSSAIHTFSKLARMAARRGVPTSGPKAIMPLFLERLSVAIRSAKARAVLRRCGSLSEPTTQAIDAAATVLASD